LDFDFDLGRPLGLAIHDSNVVLDLKRKYAPGFHVVVGFELLGDPLRFCYPGATHDFAVQPPHILMMAAASVARANPTESVRSQAESIHEDQFRTTLGCSVRCPMESLGYPVRSALDRDSF